MLPVDSASFRALAGLGCVAVDSAKDSHVGPWALSKKGYFVQLRPLPLSGMPERQRLACMP